MREKIRILYMHDSPILGGAENSLLNLIGNLDRNQFEPYFALFAEGPFAEELRKLGVEPRFVDFPELKRPRPAATVRSVRNLMRLIRELAVHLTHSNTPRSNFYGGVAGRLTGRGVIWHARNLLVPGMIDIDNLLGFLPDRILCNSDAIRARFKGRTNAITIINGVNLDMFDYRLPGLPVRQELGIRPHDKVVGIISRLEPEKGHNCFLQAAQCVAAEVDDVHFLIVGKAFVNPEQRETELHELAASLGLGERVTFAGFRRDMPQVLASIDILVLAADAEPCGRVLFEAMAMQKPVVGTHSGGTPEIVADGETGILFPPRDSEALARALLTLLRDETKAKKMGAAGRRRAMEHFTIQAHVRKTENVYREVLAERRMGA